MGDFSAGAALLLPDVRLIVSYDRRSKEFRGQAGDDEFLSLNLSFAN